MCSCSYPSTPRNFEKRQRLHFAPFPKVFKYTGLCWNFNSWKFSEMSRCDQSNRMLPPAMQSTIYSIFPDLTSGITGANPWTTDGKKTLPNLRSIAPKQNEVRVPEAVVQGVKEHLQKFWFVENPGKVHENPLKSEQNLWKCSQIPEILGELPKNAEKLAPNVVWLWKIGTQCGKNHRKTFFSEVNPNMMKSAHKEWGEIRAKIFRTPKNLPAPTPMAGSVGLLCTKNTSESSAQSVESKALHALSGVARGGGWRRHLLGGGTLLITY